ncbi:ribonuclease H-like domain-containing protein [Tanacetum coccineum]
MCSSSSSSYATVTYTSISSDDDLPPWGFHLKDAYELEALEAAPQSGWRMGTPTQVCVRSCPNISAPAGRPFRCLTDENHVLLNVPRKDNMYSVDLKNVIPQGGLICLFAKATPDESNLWHRRLGHVNFKTMNKLVRGNLVRGLPSKFFEINQTSVAGIENLIDLRVKVIRCDNRIEFKNKVMNQFCEIKGIKREFSVARTPQQNGVAERKNRTLIEAARTMLADSKLPTTFLAKAVNTACRKPALSFMRPFGCPVTILNTIDHLGSEPNWLFDIDALTKSMNYKPVVAGNQSNGNAGTKACDDAGKASMKIVPGKDYILLPLWPANPLFSQNSMSSPDAGFKPSREDEKKVTEEPGKKGDDSSNDQAKDDNINSTNNVNAVSSTVNVAGIEDNAVVDTKVGRSLIRLTVGLSPTIILRRETVDENIVYGCADDPNMPELEDIIYSDDDEDVGAEADMNNLDAFMPVSPIPTTRIHKDHPVEQIIGDLNLAPQTRRMTKNLKEHGLFSSVQQRTNSKDFQNCLFTCFLSQEEPKKMDVKSDFLYGKIEEEVYVCQPPGFKDPDFPDKKEDEIFISQDKYVTEILKKFGFSDVKTANTPMETHKPLLKDADGEDVDEHLYRSMIGSLMYLTSSRPDIMFALDRKSTTRGCQFLGCRLISWQCKKQIVVANSITEAEDSNEKKLIQMIKIHIDQNVADLLTKAFDRIIHKGWLEWNAKAAKDGIGVKTGNSRVNAVGHYLVLLGEKNADFAEIVDFLNANPISSKSTAWNEFGTNIASAVICLAKNQKFNFSKLIFDGMMRNLDSSKKFLMYPRFLQLFLNKQIENLSEVNAVYDTPSHTKKIFANMRRQGKDFSGTVTPLFSSMLAQQAYMGKGPGQPTDPHHTSIYVQPSNEEPITIPSSSQPKKTHRPRKAKRDTEISQSSGPISLVRDETVTKVREDKMERASTIASSLEVEQDSGNINRIRYMATLNKPSP